MWGDDLFIFLHPYVIIGFHFFVPFTLWHGILLSTYPVTCGRRPICFPAPMWHVWFALFYTPVTWYITFCIPLWHVGWRPCYFPEPMWHGWFVLFCILNPCDSPIWITFAPLWHLASVTALSLFLDPCDRYVSSPQFPCYSDTFLWNFVPLVTIFRFFTPVTAHFHHFSTPCDRYVVTPHARFLNGKAYSMKMGHMWVLEAKIVL